MIEAEWLACPDPQRLLQHLGDTVSERKLRLFACACCRDRWEELADPRSRRAVEVAEKFADGQATVREVIEATAAALHADTAPWGGPPRPERLATFLLVWHIRGHMARFLLEDGARRADLLRHIAGNPWRPVVIDDHWRVYPEEVQPFFINGPLPPTVNTLAEALYAGEDCAFALTDALVEAGQDELAAHFRAPAGHPRGCAWLDAILGRE